VQKLILLLLAVTLWTDSSAAPAETLPDGVRYVLNKRKLPPESLSVYVQRLENAEPVVDWNSDVPRNPASVMKMLTTLVALELLGPAFRWNTNIYFIGDVADQSLQGDLLIQGFGDPYMVTERFWKMLRDVRRSGIRTIEGDLLLDDSYFDVPYEDPAAFDREPLRAYNVGPNALLSNFKVVRYYFEPEPTTGTVMVTTDPELGDLKITNQLRVRPGSCRGFQRGIAIRMNDALDEVTFSGRFPSGCELYAMDRTALSHNEFTYSLFKSIWAESGGEFSGGWKNVRTPEELAPDIVFSSMPLSEIITRINKHSNNVMARQLLYTLGAEVNGPPGTEEGGRAVVHQWLNENGFLSDDIRVANGAGLSRDARLTSKLLVDLLRFAYRSPYMPEFVSSLSLSGLDGTLSRRFRNSNLAGRAHMKTGSLDNVTALAGYFQSRSGSRFLIAMMQNYTDVHRGPGEEVQAALLSWLYEQ